MIQPVTFLVWTENSPGVLLRLTTLFTRRKVNVESLTVSATERDGISRFTVVVNLDPALAATVGRQVERMVEVRRVFVFTDVDLIHREVALFRVTLSQDEESRLQKRHPGMHIINRGVAGVLLQLSGTETEISSLLSDLKEHRLHEFVRSGRIAVTPLGNYEDDLSRSMHEIRPGSTEGPGL